MSRMKLGRESYQVLRHVAGGYNDDGLWTDGTWERVTIRASIHRGLYWNSMKFTNAGDSTKQAISIRSDHPLYMANPPKDSESDGQKADIVIDDGTYWQVREAGRYKNLRATAHWEAVAVRLDESELPRGI